MEENIETTQVAEEIGEEYNASETQDNTQESVKEEQSVENDNSKESVAQKKQRTREELEEIAEELLGVPREKIVVDKNGKLKLVVNINGKDRLVDPKSDLVKGFNLNQAGYEKLEESKAIQKQVKDFVDSIKADNKNIWKLADQLGLNKEELARQLLEEKLAELEMSPEEKRFKDLERREAELLKKEEEEKLKAQTVQEQQAKQIEIQKYDKELTEAMTEFGFTKASKGQKSHILMGAIGELMVANRAGRDLSCRDAVYRAKQKWQDYVHGVFDDIGDDHITKIIPQRIINAIRKADLKNIDLGIPTSNSKVDSIGRRVELPEVNDRPPKKRKVSIEDYFSTLTG